MFSGFALTRILLCLDMWM